MCLVTVAFEYDGYMRNVLVVSVGNVMMKPDLIACSRVIMLGENNEAW